MAKFNVQQAMADGYTEAEIVDFLSKEQKFNADLARKDGYTDWEILGELTKPKPGAGSAAYGGFRRSLGELGVLAADTLPALAASALLPEEKVRPFVKRQLREAAQTREELEEKYPTVYKSYKDVEGVGSGFGYVSERFGELLPDILPSIVSGGIGLKAGRTLATKAGSELAEQVAGKTERELMEQGLENVTSAELKNIADRAGQRAALKLSDDYARAGVGAGAFLGSYAQNAPEVFENIIEETGEFAPAGALLFGGLSSMLDSYLPAKILGDLGAYGKAKIVSEMLKDSGANPAVWKSVLKEGGKAAASEGVTEAAQEAISVAAEKFYGSNKEFFDPKNVDRYLESFFAGAAGGGALGGIAGAGRGIQEKAAKREAEAEQARIREELGIVESEASTLAPPPADAAAEVSVTETPTVLGSTQLDQIGIKTGMKSGTYKSLFGLDMTKPEDITKATDIVNKAQSNKYLSVEQKQKVLEVVNNAITAAGGTPIVIGSQQTGVGVGAGVPSGPDQTGTTGGIKSPEDGGVDVSGAGTAGTVGGEGTLASSLDDKKKELQEKLKQAKAKLNATKKGKTLEISNETYGVQTDTFRKVSTRPEAEELVKLGQEIENVKTKLSNAVQKLEQSTTDIEKENNQKIVNEIETQLQGMYDKYGNLTDRLITTKTPLEESTGAFTYLPDKVTTEQDGVPVSRVRSEINPEIAALEAEIRKVEAQEQEVILNQKLKKDYNTVYKDFKKVREGEEQGKRSGLVEWDELSYDEKLVFEDALTYYETIPEALEDLAEYRRLKAEDGKNTTLASYEINRKAESNKRGINIPYWNDLPDTAKQVYLNAVTSPEILQARADVAAAQTEEELKKAKNQLNIILKQDRGPSFVTQQIGFDAVEEVLRARQKSSEAEKAAVERLIRNRNERYGLTPEQQKDVDILSLNQPIPNSILQEIFGTTKLLSTDKEYLENGPITLEGNLELLLDYLSKNAKGVPTGKLTTDIYGDRVVELDKTTSQINRLVAGSVWSVLSKTDVKLIYDESYTGIAAFNPKDNTIRVGIRGLNETAMLHEATHAATIRVMFLFMDPKTRGQLSKEQQEAATHMLRLIKRTAPTLKSKFARAYKNVYEFISFAMTDPKFQAELRNIELLPSERLTKYSNLMEDEIPSMGIFGPGMGEDTAFNSFARAVADALGLLTKFANYVKNIFSYNPYFEKTKTTEELIDEEVADLTEQLTKKDQNRIKKEIAKELEESNEAIEAQAALNRARQNYKRISNKYKIQTVDELNANQEFVTAKKIYNDAQSRVDAIKNRTPDLSNLGISATREQGYVGNVMVEIAGAFDAILSAPQEGGIQNWDAEPLLISAPAVKRTAQEVENDLLVRLDTNSKSILGRVGNAITSIFTKKGYENLVRTVQNKTVAFDNLRELMRLRSQLKVIGGIDEYNDLATAYYSGTALAQNFMNKFVPLTNEATDLMQSLMKSMGLNYNQLLAKLHTYMIGLQEPERRHILFMRSNEEGGIPLTPDADTARIKIWERIRNTMPKDVLAAEQTNDQTRLAQLKQEADSLRKQLEDIVYDRNIISGTTNRKVPNDPNINDEFGKKYDALGYDYSTVLEFKTAFDSAKKKHPELAQLMEGKDSVLQKVMDQTQQFNKETNYFNAGAQAVIWFYGWKSYFPFKGKPADPSGKTQIIEAAIDPYSDRIGGDFAQGENTMMGRQSDADNPVLQIFTEATRSTMRKGYFMAPHALKNLINTKRVAGEKSSTISFKDRSTPGFRIKDKVKQNSFLIYQPDGSIDVYDINDPKMLRAFKGTFTPDQPLIDAANKLTSAVGQMHTRYNPAFAPLDFTRNLMTYAGIVGFKYGPRAALQLMTAMSKIVAEGGMHKTFKYTMAYERGDEKALQNIMGKDPDGFYKDIDTYYKLGGPVAYIQGLTNLQSQEAFNKKLQRTKIAGLDVDDLSNFFDSWLAMFETTSRIAAFRTVKEQLKAVNPKMTEEELNQRAMAEAKDLANFQKVGEIGKGLGAAFMFWRPAATGAVKAIDALLPAFDTRTEEQLFKYYKEEAGSGVTTDEEAQAAVKQHMLERRNARYMGYGLIGAGMLTYLMAYMLAGEDEEERNKVATDDMARWVRFLRINTGIEVGGRDLVVQWAWGFGPGAFASAGAQLAALAMGNQSFMSAANNIMDAGFESFVPLPISKIDKFANPSAAAVDSVTPSVLRPFLQYAMNTDGLGRRIYSDRQSRYGDAFLGSDNVPTIFTDIARGIFDMTNGAVDWSPSTLYFFANNYVDGASRAVATTYNISQIMVGNKDFDPRTDTYFLDSYLKAPSNYDAIQFSKAENKIKEISKTLNSIKGTPAYSEYIADNPTHQQIVNFYNKTINSRLRDLRTMANQVRRDPNLNAKERQQQLQLLIKHQNQIKSAFTTAVSGLDDDFGSFGYED